MFTIHGIFGSPFVRSVRIALEEKKLPWAWENVGFGNTKAEPHISRHPFGRIPAIDDDGFELYETQAILRYINRLRADPPLIPADPRTEARMNQFMGISDGYFFPQVTATISFGRFIAPRLGLPVDEDKIAAAVPQATTCLAAINALLSDGPYLTGNQFTLADILLMPNVEPLAMTPEGQTIIPNYPKITAWVAKCAERPSVQASAAPPG